MDEELRALARRSAGGPEDEAGYLSAALRAGRLDPRRARAAAYLGHGPSRAVVGEEAPTGDGWLDREGWVRVALHAVEAAARPLQGQLGYASDNIGSTRVDFEEPCRAVLGAVRAWLARPGGAAARAARECLARADQLDQPTHLMTDSNPVGTPKEMELFVACGHAVAAIDAPELVEVDEHELRRRALVASDVRYERFFPPRAVAPQARAAVFHANRALRRAAGLDERAAREVVRVELLEHVVPWLLGRRDSLRAPA